MPSCYGLNSAWSHQISLFLISKTTTMYLVPTSFKVFQNRFGVSSWHFFFLAWFTWKPQMWMRIRSLCAHTPRIHTIHPHFDLDHREWILCILCVAHLILFLFFFFIPSFFETVWGLRPRSEVAIYAYALNTVSFYKHCKHFSFLLFTTTQRSTMLILFHFCLQFTILHELLPSILFYNYKKK